MPQIEPMTAEAFAYSVFETIEAADDVISGSRDCIPIIAQRDRAILEAAAERVCGICPWKLNYCGKCMTKPAILAPREKEES